MKTEDVGRRRLLTEARALARELDRSGTRIVFAESCTGGLISGSLARIPGISRFLCGSAVVYRDDTKTRWLGIPESLIARKGAVSREVAEEMALSVLSKTPEAHLAASITGFLGPGDPKRDGHVFIAIAMQGAKRAITQELWIIPTRSATRSRKVAERLREKRRVLASHAVFFMVRSLLESAQNRSAQ